MFQQMHSNASHQERFRDLQNQINKDNMNQCNPNSLKGENHAHFVIRFSYICKSSHNLDYVRSQGPFRLVIGLRDKSWSIYISDVYIFQSRLLCFVSYVSFEN